MNVTAHTAADDIPVYAISTGPAGYLQHVAWASVRSAWRSLRGGPALHRRPPLRLSSDTGSPNAPRALLAYLRTPFERPDDGLDTTFHSNWEHALLMADVLGELGFQVDVVGPLDDPESETQRYDLLIGELASFNRCLPLVRSSGRRIYLATRAHPWSEHDSVREHLAAIRGRSGVRLRNPLPRAWYAEAARGLGQANAIVAIGNRSTAHTYERERIPVATVSNTALFRARVPVEQKDYSRARRHFLWLGSGPLANKGLAPVLSAFQRHPDLHLWVCGPLAALQEARFVWAFREQLFESANVHPVGWVDVRSDTFTTLLQTCGWIVSASYSEGMSGSVVLGAANGLVPVVAPEVGVDCEDYGVPATGPTGEEMGDAIRRASARSPEALRSRSEMAMAAADRDFTPRAFRRRFREVMQQLLAGTGTRAST